MLPARQQKIDISKMTEEERKKFQKYGVLPANKNLLSQRIKERKYFDSGDYAMSKAGRAGTTVGEKHPSPESIPHHQPTQPGPTIPGVAPSTAPVKESLLASEPSTTSLEPNE
ncbi:hypothetical protein BB559_003167 [Furculomyces boomerangus]|uniref:mRNA stability protein n=2 Tax=Harpellales TaxID=61421 RepID=A0A2T9YN95_9FUNG|nr:hypothetical protein BB559_003167 [Furculomyces boomerangus]PVZ99867.1 hypothetical protein BB558_004110 [Smittium angustum]